MGNHKFELDHRLQPDPAREIDPNQEEQAGRNYQDLEYYFYIDYDDDYYEEQQNYFENRYRNLSRAIASAEENFYRNERELLIWPLISWTWAELRFPYLEDYWLQHSTNYYSNFMQIPIPLLEKWERSFTNYLLSMRWLDSSLTIKDHYKRFVQQYREVIDPQDNENLSPIKQICHKKTSSKSFKRSNQIAFTRNKTARRIFAY